MYFCLPSIAVCCFHYKHIIFMWYLDLINQCHFCIVHSLHPCQTSYYRSYITCAFLKTSISDLSYFSSNIPNFPSFASFLIFEICLKRMQSNTYSKNNNFLASWIIEHFCEIYVKNSVLAVISTSLSITFYHLHTYKYAQLRLFLPVSLLHT